MSIHFEIKTPEVIKGLENVAKATGCTLEEVAELIITGSLARKAAWGDALGCPEPGFEFNRNPEGKLLKDDVYRDVYQQVKMFLSALMVTDKLASELIKVIGDSQPKTEKGKGKCGQA
jgi:hypothetical protein